MSAEENEVADGASGAGAEVVSMADGRTVTFSGKRQMLKTSKFAEDGRWLYTQIDFRNGETLRYTPVDELRDRFAAHGAEQKLGDSAAGEKDVDDMYLAVEKQITALDKGLEGWTQRREGGGMSGTSVLLRAMVELSVAEGKPKTVEEVKAWLSDKTPKQKMALRATGKLKPIVDRLEAEKAAKTPGVDVSGLLADFAA